MSPPSSVSTSFFRYLDSTSSLSSEVISTHSLWDVSGLLNCTSHISVNWSRFSRLHHFRHPFSHEVAMSMVLRDVTLSSTHIDGQRRVGKCLKHAIWTTKPENVPFYSILPFFLNFSPTDFNFNGSWCRESPWMSLPLYSSIFLILAFQAGPHLRRQCNMVTFKPSTIKKSKSWIEM